MIRDYILMLTKNGSDVDNILINYEELIRSKDNSQVENITLHKNELIRPLIMDMFLNKGKIIVSTPFDSICDECNGLGEQYYPKEEIISAACDVCNGTGIKHSLCLKCNGSGLFTKYNGKKVTCKTCKGTGIYIYHNRNSIRENNIPCEECLGTGIRKKTVTIKGSIGEILTCKICRGTGRKQKSLTQPLLNNKSIERLTKLFITP